jgi:plasmid stabilization system protein ParE
MKYRLTEAAHKDIRDIATHIRVSQKSPQNAKLVVARLKERFQQLVAMPLLGLPHPEIQDATARVIHVSGVLVIYDPALKPLTVLRVIHAARDVSRIDPRR